VYSQIPTDSIEKVLKKIKTDTAKVNFLIQTYERYNTVNYKAPDKYLQEALELSKNIDYKKGYALAVRSKGHFLLRNEKYDSALVCFNESLEILHKIKAKSYYSSLFLDLGIVYKRLGNYNLSRENFDKSFAYIKKQSNDEIIKLLYNCFGDLFLILNQKDSALYYYQQCLDLCLEKNDSVCLSETYNNIGTLYALEENYEKAIEYLLHDIELLRNDVNSSLLAEKYQHIGKIFAKQGNFLKAQEFYLKSLELRNLIGDKKSIAAIYNELASLYKLQSDLHKATEYLRKSLVIYEILEDKEGIAYTHALFGEIYFEMKEYSVSVSSFNHSLEIYNELNKMEQIVTIYQFIGKNYVAQRNLRDAIENFNKALEINEKLNNDKSFYTIFNELGNVYLLMKEYNKALQFASKSFDWASKENEKLLLVESSRILTDAYANIGNYKKAYDFQKVFKDSSECLLIGEYKKQINNIEYQHLNEKEQLAQKHESEMNEVLHQEMVQRLRIKIFTIVGAFVFLLLIGLVVFRIVQIERKAMKLFLQKNAEIQQQKDEIQMQKDEIHMQKNLISQKKQILEHKNKEIMHSVNYASKIQSALLPDEQILKDNFSEYFLLFKPRDIVSGDFYWFDKQEQKMIIVAADCTGHGISGALMSMLGVSFLSEIVKVEGLNDPGNLLNQLHNKIKDAFRQSLKNNDVQDAIDMALCIIDKKLNKLEFAGAHNCILIVRNTNDEMNITELKGDRNSISVMENEDIFTTKSFDIQKDDIIYLFTDGYLNQFGGKEDKKFKLKNFKDLVQKINEKPLAEQQKIIEKKLDSWIGDDDQVDDVLIIGIKY